MTASWKTDGTVDGPWTPAHRAALAEWSRLRATDALPDVENERTRQQRELDRECAEWEAIARAGWGGYTGPGLNLPAYRCRRETAEVRFARLAWWLAVRAGMEAREAALLALGMLALRWDRLRARPRPALVALGLCGVALAAGWLVRR